MGKYTIPEHHLQGFEILTKLGNDKFNKLIDVLRKLEKGSLVEEIGEAFVKNGLLKKEVAESLAGIIFSVYVLKYNREKGDGDFISDIIDSLKDSKKLSVSLNWELLRKYLVELLDVDNNIGATIKSYILRGEYEKIYGNSRILTDFRPAFTDLENKIEAGVIIHNLKIVYRRGRAEKELFVAMSSEDLKELKDSINRAEKKEKILKEAVGKKIFIISEKNKK